MTVPTPGGRPYVCDGGIETDLIYHHGADLREFAAFPLIEHDHGREMLTGYYGGYAAIARAHGAGLVLATPTWRANPDRAAKIGYDRDALDRANRDSVALMAEIRRTSAADIDDADVRRARQRRERCGPSPLLDQSTSLAPVAVVALHPLTELIARRPA